VSGGVPAIEGIEVPVAGGTLAAWRMGGAGADAPTVVAIHGITATSRSWLAVAAALGGRAAVIAPDLRGRAASRPLGPPYGLDAHAADVLALLDALGLRAPVIAGHSLGAYIACRFAVTHPDRVARLVLVDGGLPIPGSEHVTDPEAYVEEFLGPAVARLHLEFPDGGAYRDWWAAHPAFADSDIAEDVLDAYAGYDLGGEAPRLRSSVNPDVVGPDGGDLMGVADADTMDAAAVLLHGPFGLDGAPPPMQPTDLVRAWVARRPDRRRAVEVPGGNHYSIVLGVAGARVVAEEIEAALASEGTSPALA
jgi:pimeloyl-ACP methyl ester carboxylesterase